MELRRYAGILWRWAWLVVLGTLLAGGASYLVTRSQAPVYQASAKLLVLQASGPLTADPSAVQGAQQLAVTYADLIKTRPVLEQAARKLGSDASPGSLALLVDVRLVRNTQLLQVNVADTDPTFAKNLANALSEAFIESNNASQQGRFQASRDNLGREVDLLAKEIANRAAALDGLRASPAVSGQAGETRQAEITRLQKETADFQQTYANLLRSYEEARVAEARSLNTVMLVEPAIAPTVPVRPNVPLNTLLAALVGLVLALAVVLLIEYLDDTVSDPDRVNRIAGLPTLAVVGQFPKTLTSPLVANLDQAASPKGKSSTASAAGYEHSSLAEAYRVLRTNLQFSGLERSLRTMLVTSAGPGEGKTTTAANLAIALAQAGFKTVLVDADLRRPSQHRLFELPNQVGLTTLLLQDRPVAEFLQATRVPNLQLLPSGPIPPNPSELLSSARMSARLAELRQVADYVILDTPPALVVSDPLALCSQADGVVLVVNARATRGASVVRSREGLEKVGARVVGVILNRFHEKNRGYYYSYYYRPYGEPAPTNGNGHVEVTEQQGVSTKS